MSARRAVLIASALLWLGMLGALGYREHRRRRVAEGEAAYTESIFGKDAPVLVSKSIWLCDERTGQESRIGFLEKQITHIGINDVHVRYTLEIEVRKLPFTVAATIHLLLVNLVSPEAKLEDIKGQMDVYSNRRAGLKSMTGRIQYGKKKLDFRAKPKRNYLRITTHYGKDYKTSLVPYDRGMPFGSGGSPFLDMKGLREGLTWKVSYFDPFTRKPAARLIRVVGRERLKYRGEEVECFVLTAHSAGTDGGQGSGTYGLPSAKAWVSVGKGQLLREEVHWMGFKLKLVLEESVTAEERDYHKKLESPLQKRKRAKSGDRTR